MCGRFTIGANSDDVGSFFDATRLGEGLPLPSWNIAPTTTINLVIESVKGEESPVRRLEAARWGIVRPNAVDLSGPPRFNSKSETVTKIFSFAMRRRSLIPLESYYEWQKHEDGTKTPFNIHRPDDGFLAAAAVSSWWKNPAIADGEPGQWLLTTSMLTMDAVAHLAGIHKRNPVFLPRDFWADWLDPAAPGNSDLVKTAVALGVEEAAGLVFHQVRPLKGDGPSLVESV